MFIEFISWVSTQLFFISVPFFLISIYDLGSLGKKSRSSNTTANESIIPNIPDWLPEWLLHVSMLIITLCVSIKIFIFFGETYCFIRTL